MAKSTRKDPTPALKFAQKLALSGDVKAAVDAFGILASGGNTSAHASLAELCAFRGDWTKVVTHATAFLSDANQVKNTVVYEDMVRLVAAAGRAKASWGPISIGAKSLLPVVAQNDRLTRVVQRLLDYSLRQGAPPHELIADKLPTHKRAADDDLLHRYERNHKVMSFENVVAAARVVATRGHLDEAWRMVEPKLSLFHPKDLAQVAPIVLLVDVAFEGMVTGARAEIVLTTARAER